ILAGEMRGVAPARVFERAVTTMLQSASTAARIFAAHGAAACTDVTGFGLLGHLLEMLRASEADARLDPDAIPVLDGAVALIERGITSSLHAGNLGLLEALDGADPTSTVAALLIDPQTAGGLLAGMPADRVGACIAELRRQGYSTAAEI